MSRRKELEPLAKELLEVLREELEGNTDPESTDVMRWVVYILMDAYDLGRKAEAAEFITMAERRYKNWKELTDHART